MATVTGTKTDLKKRKLVFKTGDGKKFTFPYSPKVIEYEGGNRKWTESPRPGRMSKYISGSITGRVATFNAELVNKNKGSVASTLNALLAITRTKSYVLMEYTASESGVWVITEFNYSVVQRNENHDPYHVSVNVTMQEISSDILSKGPASGGKSNDSKNTVTSGNSTTKKVKTYTVKKGDTLWGISLKYYGTGTKWVRIADANKITNPKRLQIGTVLRIP